MEHGTREAPIVVDDLDESPRSLSKSRSSLTPRKAKPEYIIIISDDEDEQMDAPKTLGKRKASEEPMPPPAKRTRVASSEVEEFEESEEESTDEEWSVQRFEESEEESMVEEWPVQGVRFRPRIVEKKGERSLRPFRYSHSKEDMMDGIDEGMRHLWSLNPPSHAIPLSRRLRSQIAQSSIQPSFQYSPRRIKLTHETRVRCCPNVISQCDDIVAIAASTHGGLTNEGERSHDNANGLVVLSSRHGTNFSLASPGHMTREANRETLKFESVYDVQFDPGKTGRFLSAGNDKCVLIWDTELDDYGQSTVQSGTDGTWEGQKFLEFPTRPHYIRFNTNPQHWRDDDDPDSISTFVITDGAGKIHVCSSDQHKKASYVVDRNPDRQVSSICWGTGHTTDIVFAGTETLEDSQHMGGCQVGYQVTTDREASPYLYTASRDEVEALAINPQGDIMASFTHHQSDHTLSLYSVANLVGRSTRSANAKIGPNFIADTELPKFSPNCTDEDGLVVAASWSPCGTYIAAGRDDDWVDIWDHRFLGASPVMRLKHQTPLQEESCCMVQEKHPISGLTALHWVSGKGMFGGLGLITGGSDGCIRLWDTRQTTEGVNLVQLETQIAAMSLGDPARGEAPLVVADEDGLIQMYRFNGSSIIH